MKKTIIAAAVILAAGALMADYKTTSAEANKLMRERKHLEAAAKFKDALKEAENVGDKVYSLNQVARAYRNGGKPQEAIASYKTLLEIPELSAGQEGGALFEHGVTLMDMGNYAEASELFKKLTAMTDAPLGLQLEGYSRLGTCQFRVGESDAALATFEKATTLTGQDPRQLNRAVKNLISAYVWTGKFDKLSGALDKFNDADPELKEGDKRDILMTKVSVYMLLGRYDDATQTAKKVIALNPNGWERRNIIGTVLEAGCRLQKPEEAIVSARTFMVDGDKNNADLLIMFAEYKRNTAAIAMVPFLEEALSLPNTDENKLADVSRRLAGAYREARNYEKAVALIEKALTSERINDDQRAGLYCSLINCYSEMNQPDMVYDTAKSGIEKVKNENARFRIARDGVNAMVNGIFGHARNRFVQANDLLSRLDPAKLNEGDRRDLYTRLGEYHMSEGKADKAAEFLQKVASDPKAPKWSRNRVEDLLRRMGRLN